MIYGRITTVRCPHVSVLAFGSGVGGEGMVLLGQFLSGEGGKIYIIFLISIDCGLSCILLCDHNNIT